MLPLLFLSVFAWNSDERFGNAAAILYKEDNLRVRNHEVKLVGKSKGAWALGGILGPLCLVEPSPSQLQDAGEVTVFIMFEPLCFVPLVIAEHNF